MRLSSSLQHQALRFLLAGGLNTALTFILYQLLLLWLPYILAFSIAFASGIVFTGLVYSRYVFEVDTNTRRFMSNALYYLVSYGANLLVLSFLVDIVAIHERIAMVLTIAFMVPINFFCLRGILTR